jgi:replicative DNA helicase
MTDLLPPHDVKLETAVVGCLLLESEPLHAVLGIIKTEAVFYNNDTANVFRAILDLRAEGEKVDILTVTGKLRASGKYKDVNPAFVVTQMTASVNSAANVETWCFLLLELYIKRTVIQESQRLVRLAYQPEMDALDLLSKAQNTLSELSYGLSTRQALSTGQLYPGIFAQVEKSMSQQGLTGVPSGISALDRVTGGWQDGTLVIIAARPAMGKTVKAITLARNAGVNYNLPGVIFSLEMPDREVMYRFIAHESGLANLDNLGAAVTNNRLARGELSREQMQRIGRESLRLVGNTIFIDDSSTLTITELGAKAARLKAQHGIRWIIVDYLQLMGGAGGKGNREQEISSISRGLKQISKDLQLPVIALSQLSRAVETRGGDKKPQLSDLRESGSIEQDADIVIFLYRPEYYGITEDEHGNSTEGYCNLIIAKHRNGSLAEITARFHGGQSLFIDRPIENKLQSVPAPQFAPLPQPKFEESNPF